jgi:hypothetical protein
MLGDPGGEGDREGEKRMGDHVIDIRQAIIV